MAPRGFLQWHQPVCQSRYAAHDIDVLDAKVKDLQEKIFILEEELRMIDLNLPTSPQFIDPTTITRSLGEETILSENMNGGSPSVPSVLGVSICKLGM